MRRSGGGGAVGGRRGGIRGGEVRSEESLDRGLVDREPLGDRRELEADIGAAELLLDHPTERCLTGHPAGVPAVALLCIMVVS